MPCQPQNPGQSDSKLTLLTSYHATTGRCTCRQFCNSPHAKTPPGQSTPAPHVLDSSNVLRIALHLLPGPLLPQLALKLLNLFPLSLMLLLSFPHFLHIAEGLRVPALLQILWEMKGGRKQCGQWVGGEYNWPSLSHPYIHAKAGM